MPVTFRAADVKYKNSQGQYQGINSVSETTTAEQVAAVNTAGGTQVAAVQAKGQEVLNSIPSDYTALSDDVDDLQQYIKNVANLEYVIVTE